MHYPPLGKEWYKGFRACHPIIDTVIGSTIEMSRMKDASKEVLQDWFNAFKSTIAKYDIEDENIYNIDESGVSIGSIMLHVSLSIRKYVSDIKLSVDLKNG